MARKSEVYADPYEGKDPATRIRLAARNLVAHELMAGHDPERLFDDANRGESLESILAMGRVPARTPDDMVDVIRIVSDELGPIYDELNRLS